ncbi:MAG: DUF502 domain-containing protein, partial [Nitrospinales bacterium]
ISSLVDADIETFSQVVLLEFPRKGIYVIGFLTRETQGEIQTKTDEDMVNVFVPTTPNPTSGFLVFVPKDQAITLSMTIEEAIKYVISGGIVSPPFPEGKGGGGRRSIQGKGVGEIKV